MRRLHFFISLVSLIALFLSVGLAQKATALELVEGKDYTSIVPPVPRPTGRAEIVEVFNFKCSHCYQLSPAIAQWAKTKGDTYSFVSLPVFWGKQTDLPLRAYYAGEFMGKGPAMKQSIFKAHFDNSVDIENVDELNFLAEEVGLDPEKFKAFIGSFGVSSKVAQAKALQNSFGVQSTPTLVVNGKYRVSFGDHAGGQSERLFAIVEALATR